MVILYIGLMQGLENWHEQYKMPALQDLLMDNMKIPSALQS